MKYLALAGLLALAACDSPQDALNEAEYVCKDGVQYFSYEKMDSAGHVNFSIVPHFKIDGSLYSCNSLDINTVADVTGESNVSEY